MLKMSLLVLCVSAQSALASGLRIVTDIPPIGSLVQQVSKGVGGVEVLIKNGASAHHYNLKPSDVKAISDADLIVLVDETLTPWLPETVKKVAQGTDIMELNEVSGLTLFSYRENELFAGHEDDGHDHSHDDGHAEHDPHTWLDPKNARIWLREIELRLAALDPMNAPIYKSNADAAEKNIDLLVGDIKALLNDPIDNFFVYHDAFQYFERRFDVLATGSISAGDASPPSASRLSSLRDTAVSAKVDCVFSEPQFRENLIGSVFEGRKVKHSVLDPLGSNLPIDGELYGMLLVGMAQQFAGCSR